MQSCDGWLVIEKGSKCNNLQSKQTYSNLSILNYSFIFEISPSPGYRDRCTWAGKIQSQGDAEKGYEFHAPSRHPVVPIRTVCLSRCSTLLLALLPAAAGNMDRRAGDEYVTLFLLLLNLDAWLPQLVAVKTTEEEHGRWGVEVEGGEWRSEVLQIAPPIHRFSIGSHYIFLLSIKYMKY